MRRIPCRRAWPWLLLLGCAWTPAAAQSGSVAGTVRGIGGAPLVDRLVQAIGPTVASTVTDALGHYALTGLPAGTYVVKLSFTDQWTSGTPDPNGLVGELYSEIPCPRNGCDERQGTEIAVPAAGSVTIDFDLAPGSRIRGTIAATEGGPLPGVQVSAFDAKGREVATTVADGSGSYTLQGFPGGIYYVHTNSLGARADRLYAGAACLNASCDPTAGTPIAVGGGATVNGIDFVLPRGGLIFGLIRDGANDPVVGAVVEAWLGGRAVGTDFATDATGLYRITGLALSTNYRVLARKPGLVTAVFNGASPAAVCPHSGCDVANTGVDVPSGLITESRDFQLFPGFSIRGSGPSGTLVSAFGPSGFAGQAPGGPAYVLDDLPNGAYAVRASRAHAISEYWQDRQCSGAFLCAADAVVINNADATGIDFELDAASAIRGRVTDSANGDPIAGLALQATWASTATAMATARSELDGSYQTDSEGLPPGGYRLRTVGRLVAADYDDEIWDNLPCEPSCALGSGSAITVAAGADRTNIDFSLGHTGVPFYTLAPCRLYDSRLAGGPLTSGVVLPLRAETHCGVPGHAIAISANVTVVSPSALGSVSIWPFNLPATPPTSVVSFRAGSTRASNAMLGLSLSGFSSLKVLGTLAGGGTFDLIIDVNGYFAPSVSP